MQILQSMQISFLKMEKNLFEEILKQLIHTGKTCSSGY